MELIKHDENQKFYACKVVERKNLDVSKENLVTTEF
jgi:hypothetical protein